MRTLYKNHNSRYICAISPCFCCYPTELGSTSKFSGVGTGSKFGDFICWNWIPEKCQCDTFYHFVCNIQALCCLCNSTCYPCWDINIYTKYPPEVNLDMTSGAMDPNMRNVTNLEDNFLCACDICFCCVENYERTWRKCDII